MPQPLPYHHHPISAFPWPQTHKLANSLGRAWLYILDVVYCLDRYLFSEYTTIRDPQASAEVGRERDLGCCLAGKSEGLQRAKAEK